MLTTCSCQVQHVLREGQQDLCHLQGGEETAALHPAGHRVVCGSVSMPWPSEGTSGGCGLDWFLWRNSAWLGLSQCRDLCQEKRASGTLGRGEVPGKGGVGWLDAGRLYNRPEFKFCHRHFLWQQLPNAWAFPSGNRVPGSSLPVSGKAPTHYGFSCGALSKALHR